MNKTTRRVFLANLGKSAVFGSLAVTFSAKVMGQDNQKLDLADPTAVALQYVHKSTIVEQTCAGCQLYSDGNSGEEGWGNCSIFPGKLVDAEGWCASWVKKAG